MQRNTRESNVACWQVCFFSLTGGLVDIDLSISEPRELVGTSGCKCISPYYLAYLEAYLGACLCLISISISITIAIYILQSKTLEFLINKYTGDITNGPVC